MQGPGFFPPLTPATPAARPAARYPSPRPPAGGWDARGAERGATMMCTVPAGGWRIVFAGMPTRSLHARGAVTPDDTSVCPGWVA
jgi:hypothetical protein